MPHPEFENMQTRRSDDCRARADHLARLLTKEKGVTVRRYAAIAIALTEAIARREAKHKTQTVRLRDRRRGTQ